MTDSRSVDLSHEADVVRVYIATYWRNLLGDRAPKQAQLRALDAVERLLAAARKEAA